MPANREAVEQLAQRLEEAVSQHNHDPFSLTVNHRLANLAVDAAARLRELEPESCPTCDATHFRQNPDCTNPWHVVAAPAARQPEPKCVLPTKCEVPKQCAAFNRCKWHQNGVLADARQPDAGQEQNFGIKVATDPVTGELLVRAIDAKPDAQIKAAQEHVCGGELRTWSADQCGLCGDGPIENPRVRPSQAQDDLLKRIDESLAFPFSADTFSLLREARAALASPPAAVGELERAAQICDKVAEDLSNEALQNRSRDYHAIAHELTHQSRGAKQCAAAIRASVPGEPK